MAPDPKYLTLQMNNDSQMQPSTDGVEAIRDPCKCKCEAAKLFTDTAGFMKAPETLPTERPPIRMQKPATEKGNRRDCKVRKIEILTNPCMD